MADGTTRRRASEGRILIAETKREEMALRKAAQKARQAEFRAEQKREERVEEAAQPFVQAFREIAAMPGRRLSHGWAMARLAQIAEVAVAAGDIDAMRLLTLDLHKLNAELSRPLDDKEAELLVAGIVRGGPDLVREAMRRLGIREHGDG